MNQIVENIEIDGKDKGGLEKMIPVTWIPEGTYEVRLLGASETVSQDTGMFVIMVLPPQ